MKKKEKMYREVKSSNIHIKSALNPPKKYLFSNFWTQIYLILQKPPKIIPFAVLKTDNF